MNSAVTIGAPATPVGFSAGAVLAQNILLAREALDWTQQQLADAAGLARATVAQIEAGAGDPRLSTVELLARALNVSAALLLFGSPEVDAIAEISKTGGPGGAVSVAGVTSRVFSSVQLGSLGYLIASNRHSNRLEAARVGIAAVQEAGFRDSAALIGAGIASYRRPGAATVALARFAVLMTPTREGSAI